VVELLESPTARDIAVVILLLLAVTISQWHPAVQLFQQGNKTVTNSEQSRFPVVTIEIVLNTPPTQTVTINNYPPLYQFSNGEGYHLVFVVPQNKTYILDPSCCSRTRYLSPRKYYAFWLGGCVAIRTDK
jgi:hypothetical protein